MKKRLHCLLIVFTIAITITTSIRCVLPADPNDPKNTSIKVLLRSSQGVQSTTTVEDSVGKELLIGAVCFLPENLTTFSVKVTSLDKQLLLDTTIYSFLTDSTYDTILLPIIFTKPGAMNIAIEAVTSFGKVLREEAIIIIHDRELAINHAPFITTSGKINLQPSTTCSLIIDMSDVDSGQSLQLQTVRKPTGSIVKGDSLFVWSIPSGHLGRDTVIFIVTDNGIPAMKDSDTVIINVSNTPVNNPPKWKHSKLTHTVNAGTMFLLSLSDSISDPDGDSIAFHLVPLDPVGDTIVASLYQFTPKGNSSGDFTIKIAGTDNNGGWDTLSIALSVIESVTDIDKKKPDFKMVSGPASGSAVNSSTFTLVYEIKDSSGIDSVWWSLNDVARGLVTAETGGNYTFTGTLPTTSHSNAIVIEAKDKSPLHNYGSVEVILNYNTAPSEINATAPVNSATGVATQASFSWTGGDDNEGDTVYYRVIYGTGETTLNRQTPVTVAKGITIPAGDELEPFTKYYWQVVGYTITYVDTVWSNMRSFITAGVEPVVTKSPESATINEGDPLNLSITAIGIPSPTYQWFKDGNPIANETDTTYSKATVLGVDSGIYYVKVRNGVGDGVLSDSANIAVRLKPIITGQPETATVTVGDSVTFKVVATGTAPLTYQWQRNQSNISGATSATLKLKTAVINDGDKYRCVVSNAAGTATSIEGLLTVNMIAPSITSNPQGGTVFIGSSVTLTVTASGTDLTYQWQKEEENIPGETGTSFTIAAIKLANNGTFRCKVSNSTGVKYSGGAILTVRPRGMRLIPSGTFSMGEYGNGVTEPVHQVTITKEFWMDTTEVTQVNYQSIMNTNPSDNVGPNKPVVNVTWFDAVLYCNKRSKLDQLDTVYRYIDFVGAPGNGCTNLTGLAIDLSKAGYRLPTEAEWEHACRAGTSSPCYWGLEDSALYAWFWYNANSEIHEVAQKIPNIFKMYDMLGNVFEWVNDWAATYPSEAQTDPTGPTNGMHRLLRGGWFLSGLNAASRNECAPYVITNYHGFRVVLQNQ